MNITDISNLRNWLVEYSSRYISEDTDINQHVRLKLDHSLNVASNMTELSSRLNLNQNMAFIAEAIGLLHDVGRFPQYARFRTFRDSISINHGSLGAEIISDEQSLKEIAKGDLGIIITAVRFHNAFAIPDSIDSEAMLFCKMIRDADKLDIWRIFSTYYEKPAEERDPAAGLYLPDLPEFSMAAVKVLGEKRLVRLSDLKTLNDFKLMQLSWVYDLNFPASFSMAIEHGHLTRIAATLPEDAAKSEEIAVMNKHLSTKATRESHQIIRHL